MEQKPAGDNSGGAQQQPEIILSPAGGSTLPALNKVCPNCGTVNSPSSIYCYKCGLKLPDMITQGKKICPGCYTPNDPMARYCYKCGMKLPDMTTQGKKICPGCHTPNDPAAQYCYKCGLPLPEKLSSGYENQIQYAGFWMRLAAYLIDSILLSILTGMISIPFWLQWFKQLLDPSYLNSIQSSGVFPASFWTFYWVYLLITYSVQIIYYTVAVGKWGRTVGKATLRLKVIKPDGSRVSYWRALGRSLAYQLNGFTFGLSFLIIAFTKEKRGLHDYIADTIVIKTD